LKLIILCLYDAAAVASAATAAPLPTLTPLACISTLLGLRNALLEGSPIKQQDKPSDILAFRLDGVQQPGHVEPSMQASAAIENAVVEATVIPAGDSTASGPTPSASTSLVPLAEVKHGQIEAGGNASGATSTVPAEKDPIVDPAITTAAVHKEIAGSM
jgi:hypothetical protein